MLYNLRVYPNNMDDFAVILSDACSIVEWSAVQLIVCSPGCLSTVLLMASVSSIFDSPLPFEC